MPADQIAEVALRTPTRRGGSGAVFSYRVPSRLRGLVLPGQLVWVPLRRQQVQGVVLAIYTPGDNAAGPLRELIDLADPEAIVTPAGLGLARWLATTCHVPLYEVLALLLPPGVSQESEVTWRATAAGLAAELGSLPERERAILYYVRTRGETSERDLRRDLRGSDSDLREAYALLHERGLLARGTLQRAPRVRPRLERVARLLVPAAELPAVLEQLKRAPKQQAVLRWLAEMAVGDWGLGIGERRAESAEQEAEGTGRTDGSAAASSNTASSQSPPPDPQLPIPVNAIAEATGANLTLLRGLEQKGLLALETREVRRDPLAGDGVLPDTPPQLTAAQRQVWEPIANALDQHSADRVVGADTHALLPHNSRPATSNIFLLHGVTGSGKTEIYLRAIGRALRLGWQALVLVPEISLTTQLIRRFAARFPGQLAVLHSGLSLGERYDEWRRLRRGVARLAIGSRSAVFAPLPQLGLIIVDEEHEPTYKHDSSPRYHARDVAVYLGTLTKSVVILGSATPSVESYYAARTGRFKLLEITERVGSSIAADNLPRTQTLPLPQVRLVDMRRELQAGNRSIFSRALQQALATTLERNEQAILFLNRRGAASFVMCRDCGYTVACPRCSGPLMLHYDDDTQSASESPPPRTGTTGCAPPNSVLVCHTCGHRELVPIICSQCLSPRIRAFGVGTQRVETEVRQLFPDARTLRWDRDSVVGKGAHGRFLDQFLRYEADVLIGTQMIAKGLDLPLVSVVGVVAADVGLHLPDFRSGERTFQLLTQVAGRAGRRIAGAQVVLQTYAPEHYALQAAQEHDYRAFYTQEIAFRRQTGYPPFGRLVRFIYANSSEAACQRAATRLATEIQTVATQLRLPDWGLIGPAPAFVQRMRGRWRWHLLLRLPDPQPVLAALGPLYGWTVDVDPVHVL